MKKKSSKKVIFRLIFTYKIKDMNEFKQDKSLHKSIFRIKNNGNTRDTYSKKLRINNINRIQ